MKNTIIRHIGYNPEQIPHCGNEFLTGNGYFGIRGTMEEYRKEHMPSVNLAGIYDKCGDGWRESVNAPNPLYTTLFVDDKSFSLPGKKPSFHEQSLDIITAIHSRKTIWNTAKGTVSVMCERFASMANQRAIGMKYTVLCDYDAKVRILTGIDGDVWDINGPHFSKIIVRDNNDCESITAITGESKIEVTVSQYLDTEFDCKSGIVSDEMSICRSLEFSAKANVEYVFTKTAFVKTTADNFSEDIAENCKDYYALRQEHIDSWRKIWDMSYIEIDGDDAAEKALNYSIYHLNCIAPRNMKDISIAARGLSGQVYKGAVFWDTEMFMLDYYLYTEPKIAKTLINYRINTLSGAMQKAKHYGFDGAFYAWESQEGGFDACSDYNVVDVFTKRPLRTFFKDKQVHISAAVVYALDKYIDVTGDTSVLSSGGAKVIYECARFYRSLLLKFANKDYYEIHDVIGPDEYHERVNNNAYTNEMARFVLKTAVKYARYMETDVSEFSHLSQQIRKPNVNSDGVIEQFDGYFEMEDCSIDDVRSRILDSKEYWGGAYGVASHTQVIKQADVVALLCMLPNEFSIDTMRKNLEYYEPRTEHGSSLSACMYSMLSCKTGNPEYAYPLFMKSASVDMNEGGKEWAGLIYIGGTHPASEGGAWKVAVEGFAGMRIEGGDIVCTPVIPRKWNKMKFKINLNSEVYSVTVTNDKWSVEKL